MQDGACGIDQGLGDPFVYSDGSGVEMNGEYGPYDRP